MTRKIRIFDTTLRDGEQSPGASMTAEEKLIVARQLQKANVDVIEAGFSASSEGDFRAVQTIAREIRGPIITALARAVKKDIDAVWESVRDAERPMIHIVLGSSDIHLAHKFKRSREEVVEMGVEAVKYARSLSPEVQYSTEDASRSDRKYLFYVIEKVIDAGATVVNIPDTVGWAVPAQWARLISDIKRNVPNIDKAMLSVHCHNDMGMAVANSLAAAKAGADQVEVSVNGIGERAGNASLEEVAIAINTRKDYFRATTNVDCRELVPTSRMVSRITGLPIARNKAVVGANAFAHSSGIHQDGVLKNRTNYEIFSPEDVGAEDTQIVLTARSGRHAVRHRIEELGYTITPEEMEALHKRFLALADVKKEVFDEDLHALMSFKTGSGNPVWSIEKISYSSSTSSVASATVVLSRSGKTTESKSEGDGPVDAVFKAIDKTTGLAVELADYSLHAATAEKAALGEAQVTLRHNHKAAVARGAATDVVEASARAYVNAINRLLDA